MTKTLIWLSHAGKYLLAAVVTATVTLALAALLGGASRNVAQRVDINAQETRQFVLENRYILVCTLLAPSYPNISIKEIRICFDESHSLPRNIVANKNVLDWLQYNLNNNR